MTDPSSQPRLLRALVGETLDRPPVWFMRQAGRFLPEYRAVRESAPDFIAFCLDPEKASTVTLQPLRRFPFDAAIVFADILLIPMALGQKVWFEAGEGPRLGPLPEPTLLRDRIDAVVDQLSPVAETLRRVRSSLEPERALIGFAGAPWTVLTYMLQGKGARAPIKSPSVYMSLSTSWSTPPSAIWPCRPMRVLRPCRSSKAGLRAFRRISSSA
jgi:uroporphyrinogen decarboxylase